MSSGGMLSIDDRSTALELRPRTSVYTVKGKRFVDLTVGAALLTLLSPVLLAVSGIVWFAAGPGPLLYTQTRVGQGGRVFRIFKFRTMHPDRRFPGAASRPGGAERRRTHKADNDPRHTPIGRWLRASSLDELPQLINVVRGDMSLVGPRPEMVEVAAASGYLHHPRHLVRPGITGPYQVSPMRSSNCLADGLELDCDYVSRVSFFGDLKYLVMTPWAVLSRRGS